MTLAGRRVTVADTATRIDAADTDNTTRRSLRVTNAGAAAVDLGGSGVTSGAGYSLAAGASIDITLGYDEALYGIAAATTSQPVHVLETGV
jgi:hypothetical protein